MSGPVYPSRERRYDGQFAEPPFAQLEPKDVPEMTPQKRLALLQWWGINPSAPLWEGVDFGPLPKAKPPRIGYTDAQRKAARRKK